MAVRIRVFELLKCAAKRGRGLRTPDGWVSGRGIRGSALPGCRECEPVNRAGPGGHPKMHARQYTPPSFAQIAQSGCLSLGGAAGATLAKRAAERTSQDIDQMVPHSAPQRHGANPMGMRSTTVARLSAGGRARPFGLARSRGGRWGPVFGRVPVDACHTVRDSWSPRWSRRQLQGRPSPAGAALLLHRHANQLFRGAGRTPPSHRPRRPTPGRSAPRGEEGRRPPRPGETAGARRRQPGPAAGDVAAALPRGLRRRSALRSTSRRRPAASSAPAIRSRCGTAGRSLREATWCFSPASPTTSASEYGRQISRRARLLTVNRKNERDSP